MAGQDTDHLAGQGPASADYPESGEPGSPTSNQSPDSPSVESFEGLSEEELRRQLTEKSRLEQRHKEQLAGYRKSLDAYKAQINSRQFPQQQFPPQQSQQLQQQQQAKPQGWTPERTKKYQDAMDSEDHETAARIANEVYQEGIQAGALQGATSTLQLLGAASQQFQQKNNAYSFFNADPKRAARLRDSDNPVTQRAWQLYQEYLYDPTKSQYQINMDENEGVYLGLMQLATEKAEAELLTVPESQTGQEFIEGSGGTSRQGGKAPAKSLSESLTEADREMIREYYDGDQKAYLESLPEAERRARTRGTTRDPRADWAEPVEEDPFAIR